MSNTYGTQFRITTFGESHGRSLGVIIDGCPAGLPIDEAFIQQEMDRRKPGQSKITTQRRESDSFQIQSGVFEGRATGTPLMILIPNEDQRSKDYSHIADRYRPLARRLHLPDQVRSARLPRRGAQLGPRNRRSGGRRSRGQAFSP